MHIYLLYTYIHTVCAYIDTVCFCICVSVCMQAQILNYRSRVYVCVSGVQHLLSLPTLTITLPVLSYRPRQAAATTTRATVTLDGSSSFFPAKLFTAQCRTKLPWLCCRIKETADRFRMFFFFTLTMQLNICQSQRNLLDKQPYCE